MFFSVLSAQGQAASRVLFVTQDIGTTELNAGDAIGSAHFATDLQGMLAQVSPGRFEATYLMLESLTELPQAVRNSVRAGDTVGAIVFIGHGNQSIYTLTNTARYNGRELADVTYAALKSVPTEPQLLVYFSACSCGVEKPGETNLQTEFLNRIERLTWLNRQWKEVHTIAHQDFFAQDENAIQQPYTDFHDTFYKSGVSGQYFQFDTRLIQQYGREALVHRTVLKNLLLDVPPGTEPADVLKDGPVALDGLVASLGPASPVMEERDKARLSLVNIKSVRQNRITNSTPSTVYSAFQGLLSPTAPLRCADVIQ